MIQPTPISQRLESMDMLRGLAVLGILLININSFALPMDATHELTESGYDHPIDAWVFAIVSVLGQGKFLSIFALLFGAGVALMVDSRRRRGEPAIGLHYRRMAWLAVIGFLHGTLIWYGDILLPYAICGMILYPLLFVTRVQLLWIAAVLWAVTLLLALGFGFLNVLGEATAVDGQSSGRLFQNETELMRGGLFSIMKVRIVHWLVLTIASPFITLPWVLSLMIVGVLAKREGWITGHRSAQDYRRLLAIALVVGGPLAVLRVAVMLGLSSGTLLSFTIAMNMIDAAILAIAWSAIMMLLVQSGALARLRQALVAVGRMALTNYLAQSVLCTMIFYGYGLGYFDTFSRSALLGVVAGVWLLQLLWSPWWLNRYPRGPMEALWRRLTYPKLIPQQPTNVEQS